MRWRPRVGIEIFYFFIRMLDKTKLSRKGIRTLFASPPPLETPLQNAIFVIPSRLVNFKMRKTPRFLSFKNRDGGARFLGTI